MVFSSWACAKGGVSGKFICAKYRRYGGNECSAHNIGLSDLKTLVLEDIRRHASPAAADREQYAEYLVSRPRGNGTASERRGRRKRSVAGNVRTNSTPSSANSTRTACSDAFTKNGARRFRRPNEEESKKLKDRYAELQDRIASYGRQSKSSGEFAELFARYTDITELT